MENTPNRLDKTNIILNNSTNLEEKIVEGFLSDEKFKINWGILTRKEYIIKLWYYPEWFSDESIKEHAKTLFWEYSKHKENWDYDLEHTIIDENTPKEEIEWMFERYKESKDIYNEIKELSIFSWVSLLITAWDWCVNRIEWAEKSQWLQKDWFEKLEQTLSTKYFNYSKWVTPIHIHKWPWNLALVKHLEEARKKNKDLKEWQELSIWDHIYSPIEGILHNQIKKTYRYNKKNEDNKTTMWIVEIFSIILKKLLKRKWYNRNDKKSSIWEWEKKIPIHNLNDIYDELKKVIDNFDDYIHLAYDIKTNEVIKSWQFQDDFKEKARPDIIEAVNFLLWKNNNIYSWSICIFEWESKETNAEFLLELIFNKNFVKSTKASKDKERNLNLNHKADFWFEWFTQWYFTDIPKIYKESPLLITATRSDSHENDEDFKKDIEWNIDSLLPWWCLLTDWGKQSFTEIHRFDIIEDIISKRPWYKAEIIYNKNQWRDYSVLIQKEHPNGYLTDVEKEDIFSSEVEFQDLSKTKNTPVNFLLNITRKTILELTKVSWEDFNVDIFGEIKEIEKEVIWVLNNTIHSALFSDFIEHISVLHPWFFSVLEKIEKYPELYDLIERYSLDKRYPDQELFILEVKEKIESINNDDILELESYMIYHEIVKLILSYKDLIKKWDFKKINPDEKEILDTIFYYEWGIDRYTKNISENDKDFSFLSKSDLLRICVKVRRKIITRIEKVKTITAETIWNTLEKLPEWFIPLFGNTSLLNLKSLKSEIVELKSLHNNDEINSIKTQTIISENINYIKTECKKIKKAGWHKPICVVEYTDNKVNKLLIKKLKKIFGKKFVKEYVNIINIWYTEWRNIDSRRLSKFDETLDQINAKWWLVINNRFLTNDNILSSWYKTHIINEINSRINQPWSSIRLLNFGETGCYDWTQDIIERQKMYFEVWPFEVDVNKDHEILRWLWEKVTLFLSWIQYKGDIVSKKESSCLRTSRSWGKLVEELFNWKWIWLKWFPFFNIKKKEDMEILFDELLKSWEELERFFWISKEDIKRNIFACFSDSWVSDIDNDTWKLIITNAMKSLIC